MKVAISGPTRHSRASGCSKHFCLSAPTVMRAEWPLSRVAEEIHCRVEVWAERMRSGRGAWQGWVAWVVVVGAMRATDLYGGSVVFR